MTRANIVITDGYTLNPGDNPWDPVAALGNLNVYERLAEAEVAERCQQADANWSDFHREHWEAQ